MYSPRPKAAARTGRSLGRRPGLHSHESVSHVDRLNRHVLDGPEEQLSQLRTTINSHAAYTTTGSGPEPSLVNRNPPVRRRTPQGDAETSHMARRDDPRR
jgi:hypothetical protein